VPVRRLVIAEDRQHALDDKTGMGRQHQDRRLQLAAVCFAGPRWVTSCDREDVRAPSVSDPLRTLGLPAANGSSCPTPAVRDTGRDRLNWVGRKQTSGCGVRGSEIIKRRSLPPAVSKSYCISNYAALTRGAHARPTKVASSWPRRRLREHPTLRYCSLAYREFVVGPKVV
jgi:hypothetical protein